MRAKIIIAIGTISFCALPTDNFNQALLAVFIFSITLLIGKEYKKEVEETLDRLNKKIEKYITDEE